ncbi:MAG: pyridoxal-phosphate dependent enzyme, partial [Alphaproteobacteria bacterium]|nr:pyridoxal-phosphate dependent enzyme [Alphaproteobacteria bacterium]
MAISPDSVSRRGEGLSLPKYADVCAAAERLAGRAVRTPLLESPWLNERIGGRLLVKAEPLQRTGSFKFRGAYNCISQLDPAARARGVVAYSSGNHAQAVAAAASLLGAPATIVMPNDAPAVKVAGTRREGAEIVEYDRATENRAEIAERLARLRRSQALNGAPAGATAGAESITTSALPPPGRAPSFVSYLPNL